MDRSRSGRLFLLAVSLDEFYQKDSDFSIWRIILCDKRTVRENAYGHHFALQRGCKRSTYRGIQQATVESWLTFNSWRYLLSATV